MSETNVTQIVAILDTLEKHSPGWSAMLRAALKEGWDENARLTKELAEAREALEFYGEKSNHHDVPFGENQWKASPVCFDGGKRARKVLATKIAGGV